MRHVVINSGAFSQGNKIVVAEEKWNEYLKAVYNITFISNYGLFIEEINAHRPFSNPKMTKYLGSNIQKLSNSIDSFFKNKIARELIEIIKHNLFVLYRGR